MARETVIIDRQPQRVVETEKTTERSGSNGVLTAVVVIVVLLLLMWLGFGAFGGTSDGSVDINTETSSTETTQ